MTLKKDGKKNTTQIFKFWIQIWNQCEKLYKNYFTSRSSIFFKIRPEKQHCVLWTLYILYINAYTACWGYMQFRIFIIKKFTNPKLLWDVIWSNDILGHTLWGFANISNSKMYVAYMQYFLSMILIIYIMNWAIMQVAFMHLIKKMQTVKMF